jgi:hypothetical protein
MAGIDTVHAWQRLGMEFCKWLIDELLDISNLDSSVIVSQMSTKLRQNMQVMMKSSSIK